MKIELETTESIVDVLAKIAKLMGIDKNPDYDLLVNFIKKQWRELEIGEIEIAFEKCMMGDFGFELTSYGGLNVLKLTKVMKAYTTWKFQSNKYRGFEMEKPEPSEAEKAEMFAQFDAFLCAQFEGYCKYGFHQILTESKCYEYLENKGVIEKDMYLKYLDKSSSVANTSPWEVDQTSDNAEEIKKINARKTAFNEYFRGLALAGKRLNDYIYN